MAERPLPRVLIVDDQPDMARALVRVFGADAEVTVAGSGLDALGLIEEDDGFDLVLCDVMMPEMTGPQLFQRVRQSHPRAAAAFIFTTGGVTPDQESVLRETGVPCLLKPVDREALRTLLVGGCSAGRDATPSSKGR